jgi:hypothetical protein
MPSLREQETSITSFRTIFIHVDRSRCMKVPSHNYISCSNSRRDDHRARDTIFSIRARGQSLICTALVVALVTIEMLASTAT